MKKIKFFAGCLILCILTLTGCRDQSEQIVEGSGVFYLNTEGTGLVKEKYKIKGSTAEEKIEELLAELQKETDSIDYVSVIPVDVEIEKWNLQGQKLDLYFNVKYNTMRSDSKVLLRAAIVQTLTQIDEVEYVSFFSAGQPVTDEKGNEIGYQSEDDFVQNIGSTLHSYQKVELKLYFANEDGTKLVSENKSVRYNSNMSIEKVVIEELLEGPSKEKHMATFDPKTKVLGVSIKDGVCYVNLDEQFLNNSIAVDPKITIYSLVNSIIECEGASKVQILINGETNIKYRETIDLSQPFSRDLDIIEGEK